MRPLKAHIAELESARDVAVSDQPLLTTDDQSGKVDRYALLAPDEQGKINRYALLGLDAGQIVDLILELPVSRIRAIIHDLTRATTKKARAPAG